MNIIDEILQSMGSNELVQGTAILAIAFLSSVLVYIITRRYLLALVDKVAARSKTQWDDILVESRVFRRLALLVPALVFNVIANVLFPDGAAELVTKIVSAYVVCVGILLLDALLSALHGIYLTLPFSGGRPLKGVVQMLKIFVVFIGSVWVLALLMGASPWKFLSSIGALSAVLMLIFKDAILGLVASVQVSANNMVAVGDWVEMPKYGADGDVIDISLTTVKIQNWDKTISTIPTYALVSDPMKNWRGMSESGGRRIKRSINIDMHSVAFCTDEMLARFERFAPLGSYMQSRRADVDRFNSEHGVDTSLPVNGRRLTNIGCFRAYLVAYLREHPVISKDMTFLVRQLQPSENGIPIEIYVFSTDQNWVNYEGIQADIFDHILAALPEFELAVFQAPTGRDVRALGAAV